MPWSSKPKASSTARGYGREHRQARAAAVLRHDPASPCARCGHALGPMGPWLHFDHNDARNGYLGFSHGQYPCPVCGKRCNLRAGAAKGTRIQQGKNVPVAPNVTDRW